MNNEEYLETFETWNSIASLYQERFMHLDIYNSTYDFFCEKVTTKNANILEMGCGPANISKYLVHKRPDFKITGIDVAPNMIQLAKENIPDGNFMVMDVRKVKELNPTFEAIVCGFCVPYLSEQDCEKLILDCSTLLNHSGLLYLSFVEGESSNSGFISGSSGQRTYFYYHHLNTFNANLLKNGFVVLKVFHVDYTKIDTSVETHSVVIAQKRVS